MKKPPSRSRAQSVATRSTRSQPAQRGAAQRGAAQRGAAQRGSADASAKRGSPKSSPRAKTSGRSSRGGKALGANITVSKVMGLAAGLLRRTLADNGSSATSLLKQQHQEVKALFEAIEKAPARAAKVKLFDELARNLVAHDAIERELFYPACERAMGMTDLLGEALVEHGVVEFCLYEADQARKDENFSFKCKVLSELVAHHVKEEERDFFPEVEKALSKTKLEQLGARMRERFEAAKSADFRVPLHHNLNQVLAGAMKPAKLPAKSTRAKRASVRPARAA